LTTSNILYTWGRNNNSQIGDGTNVDKIQPVNISSTNCFALSVNDLQNDLIKIELHPNPTRSYFYITSNSYNNDLNQVILLDATGRKLMIYDSYNHDQNTPFKLPALPKGIYFIQCIDTKNKSNTQKLLID
jgi:hypothetical protein